MAVLDRLKSLAPSSVPGGHYSLMILDDGFCGDFDELWMTCQQLSLQFPGLVRKLSLFGAFIIEDSQLFGIYRFKPIF